MINAQQRRLLVSFRGTIFAAHVVCSRVYYTRSEFDLFRRHLAAVAITGLPSESAGIFDWVPYSQYGSIHTMNQEAVLFATMDRFTHSFAGILSIKFTKSDR